MVEASPTEALLVIGDTNTRVDELPAVEAAGLRAGRLPGPTWNSRRNRFRAGGAEFTAFFTRWIASPFLDVVEVAVGAEPIDVDGHRFHLSDHYRLTGTAVIA